MKWVKASTSGANGSVEVAREEDMVLVRDSRLGPESPVISYPVDWWDTLCQAMRRAAEHPNGVAWLPSGAHRMADGGVSWRRERATLRFTAQDWAAFVDGARAGEFDPHVLPGG